MTPFAHLPSFFLSSTLLSSSSSFPSFLPSSLLPSPPQLLHFISSHAHGSWPSQYTRVLNWHISQPNGQRWGEGDPLRGTPPTMRTTPRRWVQWIIGVWHIYTLFSVWLSQHTAMEERGPGRTCMYISDVSVYLSRKRGGGTWRSLRFFSGSVCKFKSWKQKVLLLVENEECMGETTVLQ